MLVKGFVFAVIKGKEMKIDCISDLHGHYPKLKGGDLLIVAGDLTARHTPVEAVIFLTWLTEQNYRKIIFISWNHDTQLVEEGEYRVFFDGKIFDLDWPKNIEYLCDSGTEFEGFKIWGSPWTKTFEGMNPKCKAFTVDTEEELAIKFSLIPEDVDILVTHGPPKGILDWNKNGEQCGSVALFERSRRLKNLKLFCFGHVHEAYSVIDTQQMSNSLPMLLSDNKPNSLPIIVNASHVNERYEPVNKPVRIML